MSGLMSHWERLTGFLSGTVSESIAQLLTRVALAGIFWRSYETKVVDGTWLQIDETQYFIFESEFSGLPIPTDLAVPMATYSEFLFPILLVLGLFTRFAALALMGMAMVIQLFVFPEASHFFGWAITVLALGAFLVSRGGGMISLDKLISQFVPAKTG